MNKPFLPTQTRAFLPIIALVCCLLVPVNLYASYNQEAQKLKDIMNSGAKSQKYIDVKPLVKDMEQKTEKYIADNPDLKTITENTITEANSARYQNYANQLFKQISPTLDLEQLKTAYEEKQHKHLNQLMIFISSSMPKNSLKEYSVQAKKTGAVLVLRGLINNSFKQTVSFIHSLNKEGTAAIIDPLAYRNFNVTQVPQIVVITDNHGCKWGRCAQTPLHDKIQGNISLEYALEQIADKGEFTKEEASRFLQRLREVDNET